MQISEFGSSTFSSYESLSAVLAPKHLGIHGGSLPNNCVNVVGNLNTCNGTNVMSERNYPCDNFLMALFDVDPSYLNQTGIKAFQAQTYLCMLSQALLLKTEIELHRSRNIFGSLIWQLNENWPTGGWGCLEYGGDMKGHVIGGRWKPLMYFLSQHLFHDVIVACGDAGLCYCKNDGISPVMGIIKIDRYHLFTGKLINSNIVEVSLDGGHLRKSLSQRKFIIFSFSLVCIDLR